MKPDFTSFKIVSATEGHYPVGIFHTKPAWQKVIIGGAVQHWVFNKVKDDVYTLQIGGYGYTGVEDGAVIASTNPAQNVEWRITYQEHDDAYTIALAEDPSLGWTVPPILKNTHAIEIKPIIQTRSNPPQFIPSQLFYLHADD